MLREAIELYLESLEVHCDPIPGPVEIERVTVSVTPRLPAVTPRQGVRTVERCGWELDRMHFSRCERRAPGAGDLPDRYSGSSVTRG